MAFRGTVYLGCPAGVDLAAPIRVTGRDRLLWLLVVGLGVDIGAYVAGRRSAARDWRRGQPEQDLVRIGRRPGRGGVASDGGRRLRGHRATARPGGARSGAGSASRRPAIWPNPG